MAARSKGGRQGEVLIAEGAVRQQPLQRGAAAHPKRGTLPPQPVGQGKAFRVRGNLELIIAWLVEQAGGQPARSSAVREDTPFTLRYDLHLNRLPQQDPRIGALVDYIVDHPTE